LGLLTLATLGSGAVGCSPSAPPTRNEPGGTGGNGSSNGGATGGTSNANGGNSGGSTGVMLPVGGMSGGGMSAGGASCAATATTAKLIPLDLYVMMDSSKSMLEQTAGGSSKWKAVTDAMGAFLRDPSSAGLGVGLKYFPDEEPGVPEKCTDSSQCSTFGPCDQRRACVTMGTRTTVITADDLCDDAKPCPTGKVCAPVQRCADGANCAKSYCVSGGTACNADCVPFDGYCHNRDVCTAANYATPAVAFGNLPDAAQGLIDSFAARTPGGYTPTGPALAGALQQAKDRASKNPDHKVVVVLVTDGLPGGYIPGMPPAMCTPSKIPDIAMLVGTGAKGTPSIPTFVIGVFGPCDLVDANVMPQANLDALAVEGGTTKAVVISTDGNVTQQLQDALRQVRTSAIACQYTIPKPAEGTLDPKKVNVTFSAAGNTTTIGHANTKADCDPVRGGWYYDVEPNPTQIIACEQSCAQFQNAADARVDIALGCETIQIR
jgi:hypothetical protein